MVIGFATQPGQVVNIENTERVVETPDGLITVVATVSGVNEDGTTAWVHYIEKN